MIVNANKLKQKKYRNKFKQFLIEGEHLIIEAYRHGFLDVVFYQENDLDLAVESYKVTKEIIEKLSDVSTPQGLIGICHYPTEKNLSERVLMLDRVQDPGNMGTLIRSAAAFGFQTLITNQCVDVYNPKVIRSTQGALFMVDLVESDIIEFIEKQPSYHYYATDLSGESHSIIRHHDKIGLILGNESLGVDPLIIKKTNEVIKIPIINVESLNVAVAGSILMYELGRVK